ncbi:MFS transporter [Streptomyces sp. NPDC057413]|uniref:MFS transporter n=1 Tax=Streptomyces sp. NPDC057413 TaxID=3346124 RepID=UPI0036C7A64A
MSAAGSAVGMGALPLIALVVLDSSALQVSVLAALSAVASAVIALPLGVRIEHQYKRPVMVTADLARCALLASIPVTMAFDVLTFTQLCVVGVLQTAASVAFDAASGAHLKALILPEHRLRANSLFETTNWISVSAGPPVGGLLIGALGAAATMVVDALSFLGSAVGIRRIRQPEPAPPARAAAAHLGRDIAAGWQYLLRHPGLRPLFFNALLFGGSVMMASPLMAVLMLDDLGLAPWQYGLALGLPCLGGVLGSRLTPLLTRRFGQRRILLLSGVARTLWTILLPLTPSGALGLRRDLQPVVHHLPHGGHTGRLHVPSQHLLVGGREDVPGRLRSRRRPHRHRRRRTRRPAHRRPAVHRERTAPAMAKGTLVQRACSPAYDRSGSAPGHGQPGRVAASLAAGTTSSARSGIRAFGTGPRGHKHTIRPVLQAAQQRSQQETRRPYGPFLSSIALLRASPRFPFSALCRSRNPPMAARIPSAACVAPSRARP